MEDSTSPVMNSTAFEWSNFTVSLTSCCNLRCKMCPVVQRPPTSLTREQAMNIADFICKRRFKRAVIGGGEPTLMSYFWEVTDTLAAADVEIWPLTNAVRMPDEFIARFAKYPKLILNISVDGVGTVHDHIRAEGSFESTAGNIQRLLDAGCRVAINTVVQRSNWRTMQDLYERFADTPLEWHGFQYAEYGLHDERVPQESLEESLVLLENLVRSQQNRPNHLSLSLNMIQAFRLWFEYPLLKTHPGLGCTIPQRQITVDESGAVMPCWHFPGWRHGPERNINQRPLADIIDAPDYRDEILQAIGPHGCPGCSTLCYCWDEDFRKKMFEPALPLRIQREIQHLKEYLRKHHSGIFAALAHIRQKLRA